MFWFRYLRLKLGILRPIFQLAFSMGTRYFIIESDPHQVIFHIHDRIIDVWFFYFWGFRPGPGLVRKSFFGIGKYQEKQSRFYMRQKIRYFIFYLYHQNKTIIFVLWTCCSHWWGDCKYNISGKYNKPTLSWKDRQRCS